MWLSSHFWWFLWHQFFFEISFRFPNFHSEFYEGSFQKYLISGLKNFGLIEFFPFTTIVRKTTTSSPATTRGTSITTDQTGVVSTTQDVITTSIRVTTKPSRFTSTTDIYYGTSTSQKPSLYETTTYWQPTSYPSSTC